MSGGVATPDVSLGDKLRRSLGLSLSNGYARMSAKDKQDLDADDGLTDSGTFDAQEMAVLDSGHLRMLGLMARQQVAARANKSDSSASGTPEALRSLKAEGTTGALDLDQQHSMTAFGLCRELGNAETGFTSARASALLRLLEADPEEGTELLRRNVFWPLLAACVERRDSDPDAVVAALAAVTLVLRHPPSRAVVAAQLLHRDRELVVTGLAQLGTEALPAAYELTQLSCNDSFLFVLVSRVAAEDLPVSDLRLLAQCVVALTVRFKKDPAKKAQLVALRRYGATLMLQHKQPVELLALCKDAGYGVKEARSAVLDLLQAPHSLRCATR
jgi:hypothetical protein